MSVQCPVYRETRCQILESRATAMEDWTMENILKFTNLSQIKEAFSFQTSPAYDTSRSRLLAEVIKVDSIPPSACSPHLG